MDEGSLGVHEVKLMVKSGPGLSDGGGVGQHTDSSLYLSQVTSRYSSGRLVVDANLVMRETWISLALNLDKSIE